MLFGTGLPDDLVLPDGYVIRNGDHTPSYTQFNLGVSHSRRCHQPVRRGLRDPQRRWRGGICAAVRPAPRPVLRTDAGHLRRAPRRSSIVETDRPGDTRRSAGTVLGAG
ncbi:MAG TPA: hypothetical protein VHX52_13490 [Steroidobacteraceae bacterium]|jgi:hypothetical protein|nr:hypothetical protein [Steroidobacteraceae bacterium]